MAVLYAWHVIALSPLLVEFLLSLFVYSPLCEGISSESALDCLTHSLPLSGNSLHNHKFMNWQIRVISRQKARVMVRDAVEWNLIKQGDKARRENWKSPSRMDRTQRRCHLFLLFFDPHNFLLLWTRRRRGMTNSGPQYIWLFQLSSKKQLKGTQNASKVPAWDENCPENGKSFWARSTAEWVERRLGLKSRDESFPSLKFPRFHFPSRFTACCVPKRGKHPSIS